MSGKPMAGDSESPRTIAPGAVVGPLLKYPSEVSLFAYSAAVWLLHRIHYDEEYARSEGLPGVVVHGTLAADWFSQMLLEWGGPGSRVVTMNYRNKGFMVIGDDLCCRGIVTRSSRGEEADEIGVDIDLSITTLRDGHDIELVLGQARMTVPVAK